MAASSSSFINRPKADDMGVRVRAGFHQRNDRYVNGDKAVNALVKALARVPERHKRWMREQLFVHNNKKRVRLQRVGGKKGNTGRAYVIDSTAVDGITRRMQNIVDDECRRCADDVAEFFQNSIECRRTRHRIEECEDGEKPCPVLSSRKGCDPMRHGSAVHDQVYHIVRRALIKSKLYRTRQAVARNFKVDVCAQACVLGLVKNGLYPFSAEWPVFTARGTGLATAADLLAFDARAQHAPAGDGSKQHVPTFAPVFVEIKTGNAMRATDMRIAKNRDMAGFGLVAATLQVALTRQLAFECYKPAAKSRESIFDRATTRSAVVYARSWGVAIFNVHDDMLGKDRVARVLDIMLTKGETLRKNLRAEKNHQSFLTSHGTRRKRKPKIYRTGFE